MAKFKNRKTKKEIHNYFDKKVESAMLNTNNDITVLREDIVNEYSLNENSNVSDENNCCSKVIVDISDKIENNTVTLENNEQLLENETIKEDVSNEELDTQLSVLLNTPRLKAKKKVVVPTTVVVADLEKEAMSDIEAEINENLSSVNDEICKEKEPSSVLNLSLNDFKAKPSVKSVKEESLNIIRQKSTDDISSINDISNSDVVKIERKVRHKRHEGDDCNILSTDQKNDSSLELDISVPVENEINKMQEEILQEVVIDNSVKPTTNINNKSEVNKSTSTVNNSLNSKNVNYSKTKEEVNEEKAKTVLSDFLHSLNTGSLVDEIKSKSKDAGVDHKKVTFTFFKKVLTAIGNALNVVFDYIGSGFDFLVNLINTILVTGGSLVGKVFRAIANIITFA